MLRRQRTLRSEDCCSTGLDRLSSGRVCPSFEGPLVTLPGHHAPPKAASEPTSRRAGLLVPRILRPCVVFVGFICGSHGAVARGFSDVDCPVTCSYKTSLLRSPVVDTCVLPWFWLLKTILLGPSGKRVCGHCASVLLAMSPGAEWMPGGWLCLNFHHQMVSLVLTARLRPQGLIPSGRQSQTSCAGRATG